MATKNIIFQIEGGLGKSLMATAVLRAIRRTYPKACIIVVTAYPDVFIGNPDVNRVLSFGQTNGIYKKYIESGNCKVFMADPYHTSDYITESKHLIQAWCEMYGLDYQGETPNLHLSNSEIEYYKPFYQTPKPIMAIHPHGGATTQPLKYSWTRDLPSPVVQAVVEHFKPDYTLLHIKRPDQIIYPDTLQAIDGFRSIAILLMLSEKRLLIDSSAMHMATALGLSSVVAWVGTNPQVFGYELHQNITSNQPESEPNMEHPYYAKTQLYQDISSIPYRNLESIFDTDKIINALK